MIATRRLLSLLLLLLCCAVPAGAAASWSKLLPTADGTGAAFDPGRHWMILPGAETWVLDLSGGPAVPAYWSPLPVVGTPPPALPNPVVAYDPGLDAVVVFSAEYASPSRDIWLLHLGTPASWTQVGVAQAPPFRDKPITAYDAHAHRILRFGGRTPGSTGTLGYQNDLWQASLPGRTWTQILAHSPPSVRFDGTASYDSLHQRLLLFGGRGPGVGGTVVTLSDAWALTFSDGTWRTLAAAGSPPDTLLSPFRSFYDEAHNDLIVLGAQSVAGGVAGDSMRSDVWKLSTGVSPAWSLFYDSSQGGDFVRYGAEVALDPWARRLLVHGGSRSDPPSGWYEKRTDTWQLGIDSAIPLPVPGAGEIPSPRSYSTLTYDTVGRRLFLVGGLSAASVVLGDTWLFDPASPGRWTLASGGLPPRALHTTVYDAMRGRLILFGGYDHDSHATNDLWERAADATSTWQPMAATGGGPVAGVATAIYDPVNDQMVTYEISGAPGQTWTLSLSPSPDWQRILGPGPPASPDDGALFDPTPGRMILLGGSGIWALSLRDTLVWTNYLPAQPAGGVVAGYDSLADSGILFETGKLSGHRAYENALGDPPAPGAVVIPVEDSSPAVSSFPALGFDPDTRSMYVFGGRFSAEGTSSTDQTLWRLDLAPAPGPSVTLVDALADPYHTHLTWQLHDPVAPGVRIDRLESGGAWQPMGFATADPGGTIVFDDSSVLPATTYFYRVALPTVTGEVTGGNVKVVTLAGPGEPGLELAGPETNPTRDFLQVSFLLPVRGSAKLELLDLRGRIVASMDVGSLGPGPHSVRLAPDQPARSGVYFLRLTQGSAARLEKVVLIGRP